MAQQIFHQMPQGLYHPEFEHDACGGGLIANLHGISSHKTVTQGIDVLCRLMHRGAAGSDPETGAGGACDDHARKRRPRSRRSSRRRSRRNLRPERREPRRCNRS